MSEQNESLVKRPDEMRNSTEQLLDAPYGMQGADIITTDVPHIGKWYCIVAAIDNITLDSANCVVNWNENPGIGGAGAVWASDFTLPTGVPFYGDFTKITIRGSDMILIAYRQ